MTKDEALRLALEALEVNDLPLDEKTVSEWELKTDAAITAIKAALEAKDEPVAEVTSETGAEITMSWWHEPALPIGTKLYTTPPQRTWVGLTDEDYIKALELCDFDKDAAFEFFETKLKEKNT
jgi:hypothetical protein